MHPLSRSTLGRPVAWGIMRLDCLFHKCDLSALPWGFFLFCFFNMARATDQGSDVVFTSNITQTYTFYHTWVPSLKQKIQINYTFRQIHCMSGSCWLQAWTCDTCVFWICGLCAATSAFDALYFTPHCFCWYWASGDWCCSTKPSISHSICYTSPGRGGRKP